MALQIRKAKHCERENHDIEALLACTVATNGAIMVYWYCEECKAPVSIKSQYIRHELLRQARPPIDPKELPVINEYASEPCIICGKVHTEYHHWAPQKLRDSFGEEWPKWPGAYLCRPHHIEWHHIVTPWLTGWTTQPE
jgi:hypothetical protein